VHVVGFGVAPEEQAQLQCIAEKGGGQYFAAQNALQLKEVLEKQIKPIIVAQAPPAPPPPAPKQLEGVQTLKLPKTNLGTIRLRTPAVDSSNVRLHNQESGHYATFLGAFTRGTAEVPAGTYMLSFAREGEYFMRVIEVTAGATKEIVLGAIDIKGGLPDFSEFRVDHQGSGKKVLSFMYPNFMGEPVTSVAVPAGTYRLRLKRGLGQGYDDVGTVTVKAGETIFLKLE
jgi:hypothetical protein